MLRAVNGLDRIRLRLDRVRAAVGDVDPAYLDTPALPRAPLEAKAETLNPVRSRREALTAAVQRR